jgi:hypothetical protein
MRFPKIKELQFPLILNPRKNRIGLKYQKKKIQLRNLQTTPNIEFYFPH